MSADTYGRESDDSDGLTVLYAAAKNGRLEVVKYLVKRGADVATRDDDGRTALISVGRD